MTAQKHGKPLGERLTRPQQWLAIIVISYTLVFFLLAKRSYDVFGYDSGATACFNNMLWNTLHGRPMLISALISGDSTKPVSNLAVHAAYFWWFIVPLYAVAPGPTILFFLQALALGLAAWPMYLIACRVLKDEAASVILATAFLLLPPLVSQNLNQVQEPSFLPIVLLFTFYFFLERRFGLFCLFATISILNRENVSLAIVMFGVWALLQRREWQWVVVPIVSGAAYFCFVIFVAMPYFRQGEHWHVASMFGYLGSTAEEIFKNAFTKPGLLLHHMFSAENTQYLVFLLQPLGWVLPFFAPAALIALPDMTLNVLSQNSALKVIAWHYNLLTGSALFVSVVLVLPKLTSLISRRYGQARYSVVFASALLALTTAHWFLWFQPRYLQKLPHHDTLVKAISFVPPDKSVLVSFRICSHVSSRERYDHIGWIVERPAYAAQFEYVLLDANERQYPPVITQEFFDAFYKNVGYRLMFAENNVFLFRRLGGESDLRIRPRNATPPTK